MEAPPRSVPHEAVVPQLKQKLVLFLELFAGKGRLSYAVRAAGGTVLPPEDYMTGGFDFRKAKDVENLKEWFTGQVADAVKKFLEEVKKSCVATVWKGVTWKDRLDYFRETGYDIEVWVHLAPPCSTFSKARDRSSKTRVRFMANPGGFWPRGSKVREGNLIARRAIELARWLREELGASITFENPDQSYLWLYGEHWFGSSKRFRDIRMSYCMFGKAYQKNTRFRVWGRNLQGLGKLCCKKKGKLACGRKEHKQLGWDGEDTAKAAAYPKQLCIAYAKAIMDTDSVLKDTHGHEAAGTHSEMDTITAENSVTAISHGRVHRHVCRGEDEEGARERKEKEDKLCAAGLRNAHMFKKEHRAMQKAMDKLTPMISSFVKKHTELQGLHKSCGRDPGTKPPPPEETVKVLRDQVGAALDLSADETEAHAPQSKWRYRLIQELIKRGKDSDKPLGVWAEHGAPMGISEEIENGGWFPEVEPTSDLTIDELTALDYAKGNHPSFEELHGEDTPPAAKLVEEHLNSNFGLLFKSRKEAEAHMKGKCCPAPLGNVSKPRPEGGLKHRLIQDLKANKVNRAVHFRERQVLPRPRDHAKGLARAAARKRRMKRKNALIRTLIIDFENAFMSIPLATAERVYNCCAVPSGLHRTRPEAYPGEPEQGSFVVWTVLGFGGKPNPLLFARFASFAMRTGQCVANKVCKKSGVVHSQVYVDDPALTVVGPPKQYQHALDCILIWWLLLGLPLSWKKGHYYDNGQKHVWIGVEFSIREDGAAVMELPKKYLEEVSVLLEPLVAGTGSIPLNEALCTVGKAGRISQIVKEVRPFTGALYAAYTVAVRQDLIGPRQAPKRHAPCARFATAAQWLKLLISGEDNEIFPLRQVVSHLSRPRATMMDVVMQVDASPWGGGATLRHTGKTIEYWWTIWDERDVQKMKVQTGQARHQTFWEALALLISMIAWRDCFQWGPVLVIGDNVPALQNALDLKGRGPLMAISREIAWRKARYGWHYHVGHLPSEHNKAPDALSRIAAPSPEEWPWAALGDAVERPCPDIGALWHF